MNPTHNLLLPASADELTVADILRCAACYLMANGWTQDQFYADTDTPPALRDKFFPPADVLGAVIVAITGHRYDDPQTLREEEGDDTLRAYTTVVDTFAGWLYCDQPDLWPGDLEIPEDAPHLIWSWNDEPGQDAATVVDTLTRAAYALDHLEYGSHLAEFALYYAIIHGTAGGAR